VAALISEKNLVGFALKPCLASLFLQHSHSNTRELASYAPLRKGVRKNRNE